METTNNSMEQKLIVLINTCQNPTTITATEACAHCHKIIEAGNSAFKLFYPRMGFRYVCEDCRSEEA